MEKRTREKFKRESQNLSGKNITKLLTVVAINASLYLFVQNTFDNEQVQKIENLISVEDRDNELEPELNKIRENLAFVNSTNLFQPVIIQKSHDDISLTCSGTEITNSKNYQSRILTVSHCVTDIPEADLAKPGNGPISNQTPFESGFNDTAIILNKNDLSKHGYIISKPESIKTENKTTQNLRSFRLSSLRYCELEDSNNIIYQASTSQYSKTDKNLQNFFVHGASGGAIEGKSNTTKHCLKGIIIGHYQNYKNDKVGSVVYFEPDKNINRPWKFRITDTTGNK